LPGWRNFSRLICDRKVNEGDLSPEIGDGSLFLGESVERFNEAKETIEELGRKDFRLIQSRNGFRFGEDTVLLSWFVSNQARLRPHDRLRVLELGANCGAASILLAARRTDMQIDAVERRSDAESILKRNILLNGLSDRMRSECIDLRDLPSTLFSKNHYDVVFMNPPFRKTGSGPMTQAQIHSEALLEARFALHGECSDFISCAGKMLSSKGDMFLVDRPEELPDVMKSCFENKLAPKKLTMVHPYQDRPATLFLLQAKKGGSLAGMTITPPLILRDQEGNYTEELRRIYEEE